MKVSAYTGTQRTQVHEQELLAMIQKTIQLFTDVRIAGVTVNLNSVPLAVAQARLANSDQFRSGPTKSLWD